VRALGNAPRNPCALHDRLATCFLAALFSLFDTASLFPALGSRFRELVGVTAGLRGSPAALRAAPKTRAARRPRRQRRLGGNLKRQRRLTLLRASPASLYVEKIEVQPGAQTIVGVLALMMLWPLVIPGVILGISILAFFSRLANGLEDWLQRDLDFLRPGLTLIVLGQLSFILSLSTLIIAARLRRFDGALEEAALDLGASRLRVLRTVTLPYLRPAMIGAGLVALLMSFENLNTTLMLVGSEPPLPVYMYGQMREGATPAVNAVSLLLMLFAGGLATVAVVVGRRE
jgi:ABC-type spermidine/putrescine transport system permease subunit II